MECTIDPECTVTCHRCAELTHTSGRSRVGVALPASIRTLARVTNRYRLPLSRERVSHTLGTVRVDPRNRSYLWRWISRRPPATGQLSIRLTIWDSSPIGGIINRCTINQIRHMQNGISRTVTDSSERVRGDITTANWARGIVSRQVLSARTALVVPVLLHLTAAVPQYCQQTYHT